MGMFARTGGSWAPCVDPACHGPGSLGALGCVSAAEAGHVHIAGRRARRLLCRWSPSGNCVSLHIEDFEQNTQHMAVQLFRAQTK